MNIERELAQTPPERDTVLTVGVFDGVHRGHQHLISAVRRAASCSGRLSGVVTFRDHPVGVLRPGSAPLSLTTLEERLVLIKGLGIDHVSPITFDLDVAALRAREFVTALKQRLRMAELVIGPDFALGYKREGNPELLTELGRELGYTVTIVAPLEDGDISVRSSAIRRALAEGDVSAASRMLGRHVAFTGSVVRGLGRGGDLGFPTANLELPVGTAVPADGVYATWAHLGDEAHMAATSIGDSPTFEDGKHAIEAYFLDYRGDLYGKQVRLEFIARLRGQVKFESAEELQHEVAEDVSRTRSILEESRQGTGLAAGEGQTGSAS